MGLTLPTDKWLIFLLAPRSLELGDDATRTLLEAQDAFCARTMSLLQEDGLKHLDLTHKDITCDEYLAFLVYCTYVGHGLCLDDIDKDSFRELDKLVSKPAGDKFKAVVKLHDLCFEFDKLVHELDVDLECDGGSNLYSLTTDFIDHLAEKD